MMRIYPLNEHAITIELGETISEDEHRRVMSVRNEILSNPIKGILEVVTAYTTVTVYFDPNLIRNSTLPGKTPLEKMEKFVSEKATQSKEIYNSAESSIITIPVCYDHEYAFDLEWVASHHRTTSQEIVRRHTAQPFTVFMIGFTPGFPYMGILPAELESPRKQNPRIRVPAGSVGLAGKQTGIYSFATPGGWQIIGRTPLKLFDTTLLNPSLLKPGDKVKFESISKDQFIIMSNKA
jgi:inhibitor of KinA